MDIGKAFTFPTEDPDWLRKVGIAALVMLIPLVGSFALAGWSLEVTRRVIRREAQPLPDWTDFGGYLVRGLQVAVIGFAYALPILLVVACSQGVFFALADSDNDVLNSFITLVMVCLSCIVFLYAIAMALFLPAAIGKFADAGQMSAAFQFREIFSLVRAAPAAYLLVLLGNMVAGFLASFGVIACVVGLFFTSAYAAAVNGHLQGQAYLTASAAATQPPLSAV